MTQSLCTPVFRRLLVGAAVVLAIGVLSAPLRAQLFEVPVFDLSNWLEDLEQVIRLEQQVSNMIFQAQALPVAMFARYHVALPQWTLNSTSAFFQAAGPLLSSLNIGDQSGSGYKQVVDPLDLPTDVLARMPLSLQRRLIDDYATIQLADSVAANTIDQNGSARISGNSLLQTLQTMEGDAFSTVSAFNTNTALLNKINSASVLGLKESEQANQFLSSAVEQLVVDNKRKRDTEAKLMNATINQWRFGAAYGQAMFSRTAVAVDNWRAR
jgi:hypothetical protein